MIQRHTENTHGRDFFVGDIHGQYDLLIKAMRRVEFDKTIDRLFSVGDLIDRGTDSFQCLSLAFEPWFYGVRGNHEMLALNALLLGGMHWELWLANGGAWILREDLIEVKQVLHKALHYLPYAREIEVFGKRISLVHAEPPSDWAEIERADRGQLLWSRERISSGCTTPVANIHAVIVGHTILDNPVQLGNVHYIDTGAFHTGNLTLINAREVTG